MLSTSFAKPAQSAWIAVAASLCLTAGVTAQPTQHYTQTNLVSDQPGMAATTDPNLVNAWGMSRGTTTPWWVSDNGMGVTTLYSGTGGIVPLVVTIPGAEKGQTGTPTGQVFNGTTDFNLTPASSGKPASNPAFFIFATEDGTISGWNRNVQPTTAVIKVNTHSASVFKGLAMAVVGDHQGIHANYLYAADFRKGRIAVYDTNFHPVQFNGGGGFRDDSIPSGYAPFNVQNIGGSLYVTYAKQDAQKHDDVAGAGFGYVDVFSPTGRLLQRLQHTMWMNSPWGVTQAPSDFGINSHDILVGQFGSGHILVFDAATGKFRGPLYGTNNKPIWIDGLWGLNFASGGASGSATTLYFSAGPGGEQHGLFGTLTAVENVMGGDL